MTERIASSLVLSFDNISLVICLLVCVSSVVVSSGWIRKKVHGVSSISKQVG